LAFPLLINLRSAGYFFDSAEISAYYAPSVMAPVFSIPFNLRDNAAAILRSRVRMSGTFFGHGKLSGQVEQKNRVAVSAAVAEHPWPCAKRVNSFQLFPTLEPRVVNSRSIAAQ